MHVIATAGHVDHGKSTLIEALTGMQPDRLAEERRRGLSIELGYAWTRLDDGSDVAFVDVPGHERFISTTLAGVGPVPAVLLVVAADEGWMPQTQEHVDALHNLGVEHGLAVVTRSDLADPKPAIDEAVERLRGTSLEGMCSLAVSGATGQGVERLRSAIGRLVRRLPLPAVGDSPRLWVDRVFKAPGAGTVVTGTLDSGTIHTGDRLHAGDATLVVRGIQTLGRETSTVQAVARCALRFGGRVRDGVLRRGMGLVPPDGLGCNDVADVRIGAGEALSAEVQLHIGAAAVNARVRLLGADVARLTLVEPLPLRVGDRCLLRDPGSRRIRGCRVLDPAPPPLRRRGAAARRADQLATVDGRLDVGAEVRRRGAVETALLRRIGFRIPASTPGVIAFGGWLISEPHLQRCQARLDALLADHYHSRPLEPGPTVAAVAQSLDLPLSIVRGPVVMLPLRVEGNRIVGGPYDGQLPDNLDRAVAAILADLSESPFRAPSAERLDELGLTSAALATAHRASALIRVADRVVLAPGADTHAAAILTEIPQPFTVSEARRALNSTRRVVLPLLELLDRQGLTQRLPDDRRQSCTVSK